MAQQTINLGAAPNDGTGDPLRTAGEKINENFDELYEALDGSGGGDQFTGTQTAAANLYDVATADAPGVVTARTTAMQAVLDAQTAGGPVLVLKSGLYTIDADVLKVRAQDAIIGQGKHRSTLRVASPTSGSHSIVESHDYQAHLDGVHKFAIQSLHTFLNNTTSTSTTAEWVVPATSARYFFILSGAPIGATTVLIERQLAAGGAWSAVTTASAANAYPTYSGAAGDKLRATSTGQTAITLSISGPTLNPNLVEIRDVRLHGGYTTEVSVGNSQGLATTLTGLKLCGNGLALRDLQLFGIRGSAIKITTAAGVRSGAPTPEDQEKTVIENCKISNCFTGIDMSGAGADAYVAKNDISYFRDIGIDYSGHGGVQSHENHCWGGGVGIQFAGDSFSTGDRGEDSLIGFRVVGSNNTIVRPSGNYPFHKAFEIKGSNNDIYAAKVYTRAPAVENAYDPTYVVDELYNQNPLTSAGDAGLAMGMRIRTGANNCGVHGAMFIGPGTQYHSVAMEMRAERLRAKIFVINYKHAVIFNTPYLYGCHVEIFAINCTEGVRFEEYTEAGALVESVAVNNKITLYHDTVSTPFIDNTATKRFTSGAAGGLGSLFGNDVRTVAWSSGVDYTLPSEPQLREWSLAITDANGHWQWPAIQQGWFGLYKNTANGDVSIAYRDSGGVLHHTAALTKISGLGS